MKIDTDSPFDIFGKKQTPYTREIIRSPKSSDDQLAQIGKLKQDTIKMFMAIIKNKNPLNEGDKGSNEEMTKFVSSITNLELAEHQVKMFQDFSSSMNKHNALLDAQKFLGQKISYDTAKGSFNENEVMFNYELKCPDINKLGKDIVLNTIIIVRDENNKEVFRTKGSDKFGMFSFKWDGSQGDKIKGKISEKKATSGLYHIEIESKDSENNKSVKVETCKEGFVEEIMLDKDDMVKLRVDDNFYIDEDQVTKIHLTNTNEKGNKFSYIDLIGKVVELDFNTVEVKGGKGKVIFYCDLKNAENATITLQNQRTQSEIKHSVKDGFNIIDCEPKDIVGNKLSDGKYNISVSVDTKDEKNIPISNKYDKEILVKSVSLDGDDRFTSFDGNVFPISCIKSSWAQENNDLIRHASNYPGKFVELPYIIEWEGENLESLSQKPSIPLKLDEPAKNCVWGDVRIKIVDSNNKLVREITDSPPTPPIFEELGGKSKLKLYEDIVGLDDTAREYIILKGFRGGRFLTEEQELLSVEEKENAILKNCGIVRNIIWDGKGENGDICSAGQYKYTIEVDSKNIETNNITTESLRNIQFVKSSNIENGEIMLELDNGTVRLRDIKGIVA